MGNKRALLDTNLLVYLYDVDSDREKRRILKNLLKNLSGWELSISSQVCKELVRVAKEKYDLPVKDIHNILQKVREVFNILHEDCQDIETALILREKYLLQYWDSLIIAVALNNNIPLILTEDATYNEITLEGRNVRLINPFSPHTTG